ncbi:dTDP-4-dehydrorhamnose reductase [bacterium]|nr:dTDP-4-dehydrorhamnose reductase [bacterium]
MNYLIIGAKGMLGTALQEVFSAATAWDLDDIDITQAEATAEKIAELKPDVVINAAAYTDVDGAQEEQQQAFLVNEVGVRNVALAAKAIDATVVQYSTDYIFPGDKEAGYREDDRTGPAVNVYGESKLAGEHELDKSEVEYYILRTAWLYGPNGKNFVETMLRLADERDELNIIDDQHGSPTYTRDLAAATKEVIEGDYTPGTYHLVNDGQTTWYGFASKIFELAGKKMKVKPITTAEYPLPARRPQWSILQNTKGPKLRAWEEALADYIANR